MKKIFFVLLAVFFLFSACSKSKGGADSPDGAARSVSPEILKLEKTFAALSPRCRDAISNGNPAEFLADLEKVLVTERDDIFLLVDKKHYLPDGYVPKNLVPLVKNEHYSISRNDLSLCDYVEAALVELSEAAKKDGIRLLVSSTYRSFEYQTRLFNRYVAQDGMEQALRYSAPPGTSQHQMGVAIDFGSIDDSFAKTKEGMWLAKNAEKYGWSLSFPEGFEDVTGYMWECWHFRYLGKEACAFQKKWFSDIQQYMLEFIDSWKSQS